MLFKAVSLLYAFLFAGGAFLFGHWLQRHPETWRCLPRERRLGAVLAAVCLGWTTVHLSVMLQGSGSRYMPVIYVAAVALVVLSYMYLDYLLTRAIGGLLILGASMLVHGAFAYNITARPVYAVGCYAFGVFGMIIAAAPWTFRDMLEKSAVSASWRCSTTIAMAITAVLLLALPLI